MKLIFLGPPAAGKGTVAQHVSGDFGIVQISTGDLLRAAVKEKTELGLKAKKYMDSGQLVPDLLVIQLLQERIGMDDCKNGFILDGFPRTIPQAEALENSGVEIDKVINFVVPDSVLIRRVTGRRMSKSTGKIYNIYPECAPHPPADIPEDDLHQRPDDTEEVIRNRLEEYKKLTSPLIDFYRKKGILVDIKADDPLEKIIENTKKVISS
ncbi:adenylate kinase [Candidatus Woesearchaeota archaeon]|nr:adenylate kinase [Candidatus Woesearchaeota archaeon]